MRTLSCRLGLCGLGLLAALPHPAAAALTPAETAMVRTVDAEQGRTLALLERLVNQNSGSQNIAGVEKVGQMIRAELEPLGFKVEWVPRRETGRAGHLIARHVGAAGTKRMLLIGHLDTVFEPDSPFQTWKRAGDWGHGPGAGDDKGGDVVMIAALRAMKAAGTLKKANITIVLTGDEEDSGSPLAVARADLIAEGRKADIALDFEGLSVEGGKDMGVVSRRGSMGWTVSASATPAHSSGVFSKATGYGAIYELVRILDAFRRELPEDKLTYNVGLMAGGQEAVLDKGQIRLEAKGKTNIVAATAVARGDLRALTPEQVARVQGKMAAIVGQHLPGTKASLSWDDDGLPPMAPTEGNRALLARLNAVNADLGLAAQEELDPLKRGAGDISFVAAMTDGLVGLGPASEGDHTAEEKVLIPTIAKQAKRAAILMSRLAVTRR